jgi:L-proline 4-hydroxylase
VLLSKEQLDDYEKNGFLLITNCFSPDEIDILMAEMPEVFAENSPRRVLERGGAVRTVFASHITNDVFRCFSRLPRLVKPASQMLKSDVYIHQFKINAKVALEGEWWEWHQDFLYWHKEDAMPVPRVVTAALFLQDVNEFNGPMLIIPGSHKEGMIEVVSQRSRPADNGHGAYDQTDPPWASTLSADLKYKIDKKAFTEVVGKNKLHAVKCCAGSLLFFHGNLLHASSNNLSPWDRLCVFASYNSIENTLREREKPRPEYIANRDFTPLEMVSDNALLGLKKRRQKVLLHV